MDGEACSIAAEGVFASYRSMWSRHEVLHGVDLCARAGEVAALVGPNGAGKTTLLRVLMGFLRVDAGHCHVGGLDPADYRRARGIAYAPEYPAFPRGWTGRDILGRGADLAGSPEKREERLTQAVERAGLDSRTLSREATKYSNGNQRRLSLAYALIGDPEAVLLDEPFTGLDPPARAALRGEMDCARARGAALLVSTHDLAEVARSADIVVLLEAGRARHTRRVARDATASGAALERELFIAR